MHELELKGRKLITSALILAVVFVGVATLLHGMTMRKDGAMGGCPFMGETTSMCQMGFLEHITKWQSLFMVVPQNLSPIIALVGPIAILVVFGQNIIQSLLRKSSQLAFRLEQSLFSVSDPLQTAFSRGILHSKIYNLSAIY